VSSLKQIDSEAALQKRGWGSLVLAALVVAGVTAVSFLPSWDKSKLHTHGKYHYWGHMVVFAAVAFLAVRTARTWWERLGMFGLSLLFGFGLEAGERVVFQSRMEWKDVLVDAFGVIGGTVVALIAERRLIANQ